MLITTNHLMRYFIYISYLGKAYSGWQVQKNRLAVQQIVEEALSRLLSRRITILGSSRTDKGVHAAQQVAHFDQTVPINPDDLAYRMNRILPTDIGITAICPVVDGAHARFDASYRKYAYTIVTQKDPFYQDRAVWLRRMPPLTLLNEIAALFCLKADFEFFSKKSDSVNSFVCNVQEAGWQKVDHKMVFEIKANRFLRGMVRSIVGTILKVATGKMALAPLMQLIRLSAKRAYAQEKSTMRPILTLMPPHGLTLMEVGYPETLFLK